MNDTNKNLIRIIRMSFVYWHRDKMKSYDHKKIEGKWQKEWEKKKIYRTEEDSAKPKSYVLDMFPYPSGEGLHAGHVRIYTASDVYARYKRMNGFRVLHPTGWDAFGLPAEQFAIKNKIHPRKAVDKNVANFRRQMKMLGFSYDWEREIDTTDPAFYKWTQWIFLKLYEKGLAYESYEPINWCPSCQTGLANEDLDGNLCERCGTPVEKRPMRQWVLKITDYADRMINDLELLPEWPVAFKEAQKNWIGRSEGAEIEFKLINIAGQEDEKHSVRVFTTRPDTLFGATFVAVSAELAEKWINFGWQAPGEVKDYIINTVKENQSRSFEEKDKTGIFSGIYAVNPANQEKIPVWVVNYVLSDVGTGAIMAVPAHDERDFEFAKKFNLPIRQVIENPKGETVLPYVESGIVINSEKFPWMNGLLSEDAYEEIVGELEYQGIARRVTTYKLRDWVFSRQRYWGEPIPIIHCEKDGIVPVPEKDLPVILPKIKSYAPTGTGESPLADISKWVNTKCPKCGGKAKRETNTMPQWAGSSWYYLRFIDPKNKKALIDGKKEKDWMPVDLYAGGAEHATRHLIYARFWHKFLFDLGIVSTKEPFTRLESVGLILGHGGVKMSKRLGNVVNPDETVKTFGADTLRLYEMFIGPFSQASAWDDKAIIGPRRFLERLWRIQEKVSPDGRLSKEAELALNRAIKKTGEDIEAFRFNTAVSELMILLGVLEKEEAVSQKTFSTLLKLLASFAPHISEELWQNLGNKKSIHREEWPSYDKEKLSSGVYTIVIQINGKVRGSFNISSGAGENEVKEMALQNEVTKKWLAGEKPRKVVYVPGKLVSVVV